jgi:hypothetical protein
MKVGVMVYGQYRDFEIAVKSWNFLDNGYDFYFSTWDKSKQFNSSLNINKEFEINEGMIRKHVPNSTISILDELKYVENTIDGENRPNKMIYHWKNCLKLIENSGKKYDRILIIRIDSYFDFKTPLIEIINKSTNGTLYLYNDLVIDGGKVWSQDLFFMGNQDLISDFIKKIPDKIEDIHFDLGEIINNKYEIDFVEQKIRICPVTPTLNSYDINKITFIDAHDEWFKWMKYGKDYKKRNQYKSAVVVCGQLREFNIGVKSWDPLFDLNCDFYFSTWNKSSQSNFKWNDNFINDEKIINKQMIVDLIPKASVLILDEEDYTHINKDKITDKQILHWKNALKMCVDSGVDYEIIIVTRPDAFLDLPNFKKYVDDLKDKEIKTMNNTPSNWFYDIFFMGNFNTIKTFIEGIKESEITYVHEDLYKHLISLGLSLTFFDNEMKSVEIRPTENGFFEKNIDYNTIVKSNNDFILKYGKPN